MNERIFSGVKRLVTGKIILLVASTTLALVLASCAAQKGGTGPTKPASTSQNGKIAFTRLDNRVGEFDFFVVEPDGGGLRKLATKPVQDNFPAWSTDGTKIAFTRTSGKRPNRPDVFTMNADGTDIRKLTGKTEGAYSPGFSPDGKRIVFVGWKGGNKLYVMNADGTNVRRVTPDSKDIVDESAPDWQPLP